MKLHKSVQCKWASCRERFPFPSRGWMDGKEEVGNMTSPVDNGMTHLIQYGDHRKNSINAVRCREC